MHKKLISYFLQGLLLTVPVAGTIYVIFSLLKFIDGIIPYNFPGLGILTLLVSITLLGFLGTTIIATPVISYFQKLLNRAPLIKTIYSSIKDLVSAFVGKKKSFNSPVLVKVSGGMEKLGFITNKDLSNIGVTGGKVAVYMPHSYAWSGNLFVVPVENITPVNAKAADIMKFIISGGVSEIDENENK